MSLLEGILRYWPIILFCGAVLAQWVRQEMNVSELKDCVKEINEEMEKTAEKFDKQREITNTRITLIERSYDGIQVTLATINTNLEYIKDYIKEERKK